MDTLSSESERDKILEKVGTIIFQKVILRIYDDVPEQDQDDLEAFLQEQGEGNATPQVVISFLSARVPDLLNRIIEESIQEAIREIKPSLDKSREARMTKWIDDVGKVYGEIYKNRQRRKFRQKLFLKIFGPIFGWVVSCLLFIALAKFGVISMYWIPNWMKRMFW